MSRLPTSSVVNARLLLFFAAVLIIMANCWSGTVPAKENDRSPGESGDRLSVEYARACLKLAEADLAEARQQNQRVKNSVAEYDIERLELHRQFAEQRFSLARQGADYSESIRKYIDLQARLADFDLKTAKELRERQLAPITDAQLERLAAYAEVCRLRSELSQSPASPLELVEHLHWETHRLSEEILLLNRRIEQLEESTRR